MAEIIYTEMQKLMQQLRTELHSVSEHIDLPRFEAILAKMDVEVQKDMAYAADNQHYLFNLEAVLERVTKSQYSSGQTPLVIDYTNWRGERSERKIIPYFCRFGTSEWHRQAGWLIFAWDVEKKAMREFSMNDIHRMSIGDNNGSGSVSATTEGHSENASVERRDGEDHAGAANRVDATSGVHDAVKPDANDAG